MMQTAQHVSGVYVAETAVIPSHTMTAGCVQAESEVIKTEAVIHITPDSSTETNVQDISSSCAAAGQLTLPRPTWYSGSVPQGSADTEKPDSVEQLPGERKKKHGKKVKVTDPMPKDVKIFLKIRLGKFGKM